MRRKIIAIAVAVVLVFCLLPATALAGTYGGGGLYYSDGQITALQTFLGSGSGCNGAKINAAYNQNDPATWTGITWTGDGLGSGTPKLIHDIDWHSKGLTGNLNLQDLSFASIDTLDVHDNSLTGLDMSGCSNTVNLDCSHNLLESFTSHQAPLGDLLDTRANNLLNIDVVLLGEVTVTLASDGNGYVELYWDGESFSTNAVPKDGYKFLKWTSTEDGSDVSTETNLDLDYPPRTLLAHFESTAAPTPTPTPAPTAMPAGTLTITPSPITLYVGGRGTLTPSVKGGIWQYDKNILSLIPNGDGTATIKGLAPGKVVVNYTVGWASGEANVTVLARSMPQTGQDFTAVYILLILAGGAAVTAMIVFTRKRAKAR